MKRKNGVHIYFCAFEPKEKGPDAAPKENELEPC